MEKVHYCINCNCAVEGSKGKRFLLSTKCPAKDFDITFGEALVKFALILNKRVEIEPVNVLTNESRYLCRECGNEFSTGMKYISSFNERQHKDSYVASKLKVENPKTPQRLPPVVKKTTPVGEKMKKFLRNSNSREIAENKVVSTLTEELENLKMNSSLRVSQISEGNWLPTHEKLREEMEEYSPLLLKILEICLHKSSDPYQFEDRIRAVLGLILFSQTQKASLFQKNVAMILILSRASMKISKIFRFNRI
jgi:hypothetical protein